MAEKLKRNVFKDVVIKTDRVRNRWYGQQVGKNGEFLVSIWEL